MLHQDLGHRINKEMKVINKALSAVQWQQRTQPVDGNIVATKEN